MKIIVGGGVSGLWLAAELKARGIHCCVLDRGPLGQGQTLASQGMIHGGTKYAQP
jgi:Glycerol-3-phosphate dehydrogenase